MHAYQVGMLTGTRVPGTQFVADTDWIRNQKIDIHAPLELSNVPFSLFPIHYLLDCHTSIWQFFNSF